MKDISIVEKQHVRMPTGEGERMWLDYAGDRYCAIVTQDHYPDDTRRWHISLSREADIKAGNQDVPVWRDFVAIIHQLRPGIVFAIPVPPRNQWMNKNPNVLHAHEIHDEALSIVLRANAAAVAGTAASEPS